MLFQFIQTKALFSWCFDILFNVLSSPIYVPTITKFSKATNLNLILFPNLQLPEIKSLHIKLLCFIFYLLPFFP